MGNGQSFKAHQDYKGVVAVFLQNLPRQNGQLQLPITLKADLVSKNDWQRARAKPEQFLAAFNAEGKNYGFRVTITKDTITFRERD